MVELSQMIDNFVATIQADSQATGHAKNHDNNHENVIVSATSFGLASFIDHTLLKADATAAEIERICLEARKYEFAAVCVNSSFIPLVTKLLAGSKTIPISVVGFPLGAASTESKAFEARKAVQDGACEIDMVIHVGELKNREYENVLEDIRAVVEASKPWPVKVILETCLLNDEQKIAACALAKTAGAAFVKTSTGFGSGGATIADIRLMRRAVGPEMGVKASGGIRTREDAIQMIKAGANRIGASAGVAMVSSGTDTANLSTHLNHTNANKGSY